MRYVLITGITGRLGRPLSERLRNDALSVACIVRKSREEYDFDFHGFKVIQADISDRNALAAHVDEMRGKVETIVHMATVGVSAPKKDLQNIILNGTVNVYDFANQIGCSKFIYLSSIAAAGWSKKNARPMDEKVEPSQERLGGFGRAKLTAEKRLMKLAAWRPTKVSLLRIGNIYGPPTKLSFIKSVVEMLRKKDKIFFNRAKESVMWSPIHIRDVIECIMIMICKEGAGNEAYFLTGSETATLGELTAVIAPLVGASVSDMEALGIGEKVHLAVRKALDGARSTLGRPSFPDFLFSNEKIARVIGFSPKVKLSDGIKETVMWALSCGKL